MDIDSIISQAGAYFDSRTEQASSTPLSDDTISNVLQEYGFSPAPQEPEETPEPEERVEEEVGNTEEFDSSDVEDAEFSISRSEIEDDTEFPLPEEPSTEVSASEFSSEESEEPESPEEPQESSTPIPTNSPTLLIDNSTSRFSGAAWFQAIQEKEILLAGLGGIGSWTALMLARTHPAKLLLYDDDTVEEVNMAGQFYGFQDVGSPKADVLTHNIRRLASTFKVYAINSRFTENSSLSDIMICGFDSMESRKLFFRCWNGHVSNVTREHRKKCLFIDGRLSMNVFQVFCITGDDDYHKDKYYKEWLFDSSEAEETVCSMKQTTYLAAMIGSYITNMFINFVANSTNPVIPYDLPFFTEYDAQNVIFKTSD